MPIRRRTRLVDGSVGPFPFMSSCCHQADWAAVGRTDSSAVSGVMRIAGADEISLNLFRRVISAVPVPGLKASLPLEGASAVPTWDGRDQASAG